MLRRQYLIRLLTGCHFAFVPILIFVLLFFINPLHHIHSLVVRRRLRYVSYVGIRAVYRFTYQYDNAPGQTAKIAYYFSQQNNVTFMNHHCVNLPFVGSDI